MEIDVIHKLQLDLLLKANKMFKLYVECELRFLASTKNYIVARIALASVHILAND